MELTVAISTHGGYAGFLQQSAHSALEFADHVVIYDDGGECEPVEGCRYVALPKTGFCTLARQTAIAEAEGDFIMHMDADDWMCARPPEHDADWIVSDLRLSDGGVWCYEGTDHSLEGARRYVREHRSTPICSKSVWRLGWLRDNGLSWYEWPNTSFAEDCRTEIEYLKYDPRIVYDPAQPFYVYRIHAAQDSNNAERRKVFERDLARYLKAQG